MAPRPHPVSAPARVRAGDSPVRAADVMKVTVKLGSSLRSKAPDFEGGEGVVEVAGAGPVRVHDVMAALGISDDEVNLIYRNHRLAATTARLDDGDRLGLFPPNFIHFSQFYLRRDED